MPYFSSREERKRCRGHFRKGWQKKKQTNVKSLWCKPERFAFSFLSSVWGVVDAQGQRGGFWHAAKVSGYWTMGTITIMELQKVIFVEKPPCICMFIITAFKNENLVLHIVFQKAHVNNDIRFFSKFVWTIFLNVFKRLLSWTLFQNLICQGTWNATKVPEAIWDMFPVTPTRFKLLWLSWGVKHLWCLVNLGKNWLLEALIYLQSYKKNYYTALLNATHWLVNCCVHWSAISL